MSPPSEMLCPGCFEPVGKQRRCNRCGYDQDADRSVMYLPHLHVLDGHFLVGRVLGRPGGFGITYLGWDVNLERKVAIKEYLPKRLAIRAENGTDVQLRDPGDRQDFEFGRKEFLAEARTVARFDHPNVVRVRNFFRANQTAYLVMDYYSGISLADHISDNQQRVPLDTAVSIIRPILNGLQMIHDQGYLHRDVKPANIYLASVGRPILLDFGAARLATSKQVEDTAVVLTDGYAPIEQYQRGGKQGPWTDVYGAAATLYRLLSGEILPIAMDRIGADELVDLERQPDLPPRLLETMRRALAVHVEDRTSSARQFGNELEAALDRESSSRRLLEAPPEPTPEPQTPVEQARAQIRNLRKRQALWPWPQALLLLAAALLAWQLLPGFLQAAPTPLQAAEPAADWAGREAAALAARAPPADIAPPMQAIPAGAVRQNGRAVMLPAFAISRTPVSVAAFRSFVEAIEYRNPAWSTQACANPAGSRIASWQAPGRPQDDADPVVCVSWDDARAFAVWLSRSSGRHFRLPSLAEWYRVLASRAPAPGQAERHWSCSGHQGRDAALRCLRRAEDGAALQLLRLDGQTEALPHHSRASDLGFFLVEELD